MVLLNETRVKEIAQASPTSKVIFGSLASRQRMRHQTDITRMQTQLKRAGQNIDTEAFMNTFKELEKAGVGSIVYGRKNNPNRFKWNYNLKDIGQAFAPTVSSEPPKVGTEDAGQVSPKKRGRGRPKGSKNKVKKLAAPLVKKMPEEVKGKLKVAQLTATIKKGDTLVRVGFVDQEALLAFLRTL